MLFDVIISILIIVLIHFFYISFQELNVTETITSFNTIDERNKIFSYKEKEVSETNELESYLKSRLNVLNTTNV
jgi:hypothetical protein